MDMSTIKNYFNEFKNYCQDVDLQSAGRGAMKVAEAAALRIPALTCHAVALTVIGEAGLRATKAVLHYPSQLLGGGTPFTLGNKLVGWLNQKCEERDPDVEEEDMWGNQLTRYVRPHADKSMTELAKTGVLSYALGTGLLVLADTVCGKTPAPLYNRVFSAMMSPFRLSTDSYLA